MKKVLCLLTALVMCASFVLPALAEETTIDIPSNGPSIKKAALGELDVKDCLVVTDVNDAVEGNTDVSQEVRDELQKVYDELSSGAVKLPGVEGDVRYLELSNLSFAASCANHADHAELAKKMADGEPMVLGVTLEVQPQKSVIAFVYVDGAWEPLECRHEAGAEMITVVMETLGHVVFVEIPEGESGEEGEDGAEPGDEISGGETFVPSVTYKGNPEIEDIETNMEGSDIFGEGETIAECVVLTSVAQAKSKTTDISQEERDLLVDLYEQLKEGTMKLPLQKRHVIRELVDVSFKYEGCTLLENHGNKEERLGEEGITLTVVFKLNVGEEIPKVLCYVDGQWTPIKSVENNGDGTITCVFEDIGPMAICVDGRSVGETPNLGAPASHNMGIWVSMMVLCAAGIAVLIPVMNKKVR